MPSLTGYRQEDTQDAGLGSSNEDSSSSLPYWIEATQNIHKEDSESQCSVNDDSGYSSISETVSTSSHTSNNKHEDHEDAEEYRDQIHR